ncbi:hypothetical protein EZV62_025728 [Acer yangbiense]|uniref:Uncharacterized protein n=1 Tax=Acer yangbiense TaxID=1000413 RepID=A0A5C7GYT2_9ROSI|nr:hypothetical protein EZV62_025728 [Acer yangbiense]
MAFCAILRKSASSLALTASRHARANINCFSAVFTASRHLNWKPTLGSFVPDFEFSSATDTKNYSSNESLHQAIDLEIKHIDHHVEETQSEFTFKLNRGFEEDGSVNVELTKEFQDDGYYQDSGHDYNDLDESMKKAFQKMLEVRGIKPSIVYFMFKCNNKNTQRKLKVLKKIKNFIE